MLDKEDVERIVSKALGREVKLSEMEVVFSHFYNCEDPGDEEKYPCGIWCDVAIDGKDIENEEGDGVLNEYLTNIPSLCMEYYFNFDMDEFGSFERYPVGI